MLVYTNVGICVQLRARIDIREAVIFFRILFVRTETRTFRRAITICSIVLVFFVRRDLKKRRISDVPIKNIVC